MSHTLDYASPKLQRHRKCEAIAMVATFLSPFAGASAVYTAAHGAHAYFGTLGGCATGRHQALFELNTLTPAAAAIPAAAWLLTHQLGFPTLLCRLSFWAALAAWLTANLCTGR